MLRACIGSTDSSYRSMMFYNSGYPINVTRGIDLNKDGVLNDRLYSRDAKRDWTIHLASGCAASAFIHFP